MRTVVSNSEVYHLWANQAQRHAHSNNRSFSAEDAYSYNALIGRIVTNSLGEKAYLINKATYSVTTSRAQSDLRRAVPSGERVFLLEGWLTASPSDQLAAIVFDIPELALRAKRARQARSKEHKLRDLRSRLQDAADFAAFHGLPAPAVAGVSPETEDIDAILRAVRADYNAAVAARDAEAEAERLREQAQAERRGADAQEALGRWIAGEPLGHLDSSRLHSLPFASLRLDPDDCRVVETTQGARVGVGSVRRAAAYVLRLIARADKTEQAQYPEREVGLGPYSLKSVQPNGDVIVGCHTFQAAEVRRFAAVLGALPKDESANEKGEGVSEDVGEGVGAEALAVAA